MNIMKKDYQGICKFAYTSLDEFDHVLLLTLNCLVLIYKSICLSVYVSIGTKV